jgi:predicted nucleic acid-binding protein
MNAFADTNWLVATYFPEMTADRHGIVERYTRKQSEPWIISHIVLLEARNVFARVAHEPDPDEWHDLQSDLGRRLYVDTMQWDLVRQKTNELFSRYSHKAQVGTFDAVLVSSALLTGARKFLSFDSQCKVLAAAERLTVFPELNEREKALLAELR